MEVYFVLCINNVLKLSCSYGSIFCFMYISLYHITFNNLLFLSLFLKARKNGHLKARKHDTIKDSDCRPAIAGSLHSQFNSIQSVQKYEKKQHKAIHKGKIIKQQSLKRKQHYATTKQIRNTLVYKNIFYIFVYHKNIEAEI